MLDLWSLPLRLAATLAAHLPEDSRSMRALSGQTYTAELSILMHIYDRLNWLCWAQTKDGAKGRGMPRSIFDLLEDRRKKERTVAFTDADSFERRRRAILNG